jgi:hypothetical protein
MMKAVGGKRGWWCVLTVLVGEGAGETEARQRRRTPRLKPWKIHLLLPHATLHRAQQSAWINKACSFTLVVCPSKPWVPPVPRVFSLLFYLVTFLVGRKLLRRLDAAAQWSLGPLLFMRNCLVRLALTASVAGGGLLWVSGKTTTAAGEHGWPGGMWHAAVAAGCGADEVEAGGEAAAAESRRDVQARWKTAPKMTPEATEDRDRIRGRKKTRERCAGTRWDRSCWDLRGSRRPGAGGRRSRVGGWLPPGAR